MWQQNQKLNIQQVLEVYLKRKEALAQGQVQLDHILTLL